MTTTKHTPEPWVADGMFIGTREEDSQTIAYADDHRNRKATPVGEKKANASRIVACVNACEGVEASEIRRLLEDGAHLEAFGREIERLKAVHKDLMAALEELDQRVQAEEMVGQLGSEYKPSAALLRARAAIAKAKGA